MNMPLRRVPHEIAALATFFVATKNIFFSFSLLLLDDYKILIFIGIESFLRNDEVQCIVEPISSCEIKIQDADFFWNQIV